MTYVRMTPARHMARFENRMSRFMNEVMGNSEDEEVVERVWMPRVDIKEEGNTYHVLMDLPGVNKEDVNIMLEDGVLTISGERKSSEEEEKQRCHLNERAHGKFSRRFTLQNVIDTEKIEAKIENGVLTVSLPKLEAVLPRKIEVSAN